jgi:hypothetical protein
MPSRPPIYLNVGCGFDAPEGWTNIDSSPSARLEKLPVVGRFMGALTRNPQRFPANVSYGDMVGGRLFPDATVEAIYASHVLEHLSLEDMRKALSSLCRMLRAGGKIRLIVPDLAERARRYVESSSANDPSAAEEFLRSCYLGRESRPKGAVGRVRDIFGASHHLWMWDDPSMRRELERAGFVDLRRASFGDSTDPMFKAVENPDRFIDNGIVEIAFEARKPT